MESLREGRIVLDVSVVIISYNEAEYIARAVESCINQEFSGSMEIIIGDDGSSDDSISVIQELEERYPGIIRHYVMDRNDGVNIPSVRVSNNIKRALSDARGRYMAVLSADDYFCSTSKFQDAYDFLESDVKKKYSAVFTDFVFDYPDDKKERLSLSCYPSGHLMVAQLYFHISTFVFRRERLAKDVLPDRFIDDLGLTILICSAGKIKHFNNVSFAYMQRPSSIMHKSDNTVLELVNVMVIQDIYNKKIFRFAALSRMYPNLLQLFRLRTELQNKKYDKYFADSAKYDHDFISMVKNYESSTLGQKLKLQLLLSAAGFSRMCFKVFGKVSGLFYKKQLRESVGK